MAYESTHTGPEVDAAVSLLGDIQTVRTDVANDKSAVVTLAAQVVNDAAAASASATAASASETNALASENAAAGSASTADSRAAAAQSSLTQAIAARNAAQLAAGEASNDADATAADRIQTGLDVIAAQNYAQSIEPYVTMMAVQVNHIGVPGRIGFGVGICPVSSPGYTPAAGAFDVASEMYGNYIYSDGSIMCWIPAFYYKFSAGNAVDIRPFSAYEDRAVAQADGYALHRAFVDGGQVQPGFFVDKYQCSNNGGIASSKPMAPPLSAAATHNPFSGLAGSPANILGSAFDAAKTRGSQFFPTPRYMRAALALLSLAHGQEATSTAYCAWYDADGNTNFPKGNNTALRDANDATVTFVSDGYTDSGATSALTGSASILEKTTHNGQKCGVADLNGSLYDITPGLTAIAFAKPITAASKTNPVVLTCPDHGATTGDLGYIASGGGGGMTQLESRVFRLTVIDANTISLDNTDGSGFDAYVSGGSVGVGQVYTTKESWSFKDYTGGASSATDHWGSAGATATMDRVEIEMSGYPSNSFSQRFGNAANEVFSADLTGVGYVMTGLGLPQPDGYSASGANKFGTDYYYHIICVNQLCPLSGLGWSGGSSAGVWALSLSLSRASSSTSVGLRSASYLES